MEQWSTACINISSDKLWLSKTCSLTEAIYKVAPSYLQHGDIPVSVLCQLESCEETRDSPCNMRMSVWPPFSHLPAWLTSNDDDGVCLCRAVHVGERLAVYRLLVYCVLIILPVYSILLILRHVRSGSPLHSHKAQHLKIHNSRFLNVMVEGSNQPPSWLCKFPPSSWPLQRWL